MTGKQRSLGEVLCDLKSVHGDTVSLDVSTYTYHSSICRFVDVIYGEWWSRPCYVTLGHHHPERTKANRMSTLTDVKAKLTLLFGDEVTIDETTFVNGSTKAKFIDQHGEWFAAPSAVLQGKRSMKWRGLQRRVPVETVQQRIKDVHGDEVMLNADTYVNMHTKALFIDREHGEWWALPYSVFRGSGHSARTPYKQGKTMTKNPPVIHWKTGKVCYSRSGYEYAVLLWLNACKVDYDWQTTFVTPFKTKCNRNVKYIVDLYVKSGVYANTFIEIKGYWRDESAKKWVWFTQEHENAVVWDTQKLQSFGFTFQYRKSARKKGGSMICNVLPPDTISSHRLSPNKSLV